MARTSLSVLTVTLVGLGFVSFTSLTSTDLGQLFLFNNSRPPAESAGDWRWAASAPGMNLYVAYRGASNDGRLVYAWVDRRHFSNFAGVHKNLIALRRFDCAHTPQPDTPALEKALSETACRLAPRN